MKPHTKAFTKTVLISATICVHIRIRGYWSHFTTWYLLIALSEFLTSQFCLDIYWSYAYYFYNRNQGYEARVKLAALDHNAHLQREQVTNDKGEKTYHRKYRKQTKQWDVTPVMENKKYEYIPELMESVRLMRRQTTFTLCTKNVVAENHPSRRQATIAHTAPSSTDELVKNKRSRFH